MKNIIVIGGVAAGMSCAAKLHRESKDVEITVYEMGKEISYGACGLPYYIGDVISDSDQLIIKRPEDFITERFDIKIMNQVIRVNPVAKTIVVRDLTSGTELEKSYDQLVVASGASPVQPDFMKKRIKNVFVLRDIPDGERIKKVAMDKRIRNVAIIGGGYIGLELAEAFSNLGKDVIVINRSENIMKTFDSEIRAILLDELHRNGIELHLNDEVEELIIDEQDNVQGVKTTEGLYPADLVVVAIGVRPATSFLEGTGIEMLSNGAIIVNERLESSIKDIYAIGDCATLYHRILHENTHIPLATYANKQGRILGDILAGKKVTFPGGLGASVVKIFDLTLSQVGINEKQAISHEFDYDTAFIKGYDHASYYPNNTPVHIKYIFDKETHVLLGAQMVGKQGVAHRIDALSIVIDKAMTLEELALSDFVYSPPFSGPWDPMQVAANVAKK
ncbi:MAG: CoA-disulfide reductase [Clostridia bacterium]|nr:CoA-disulfide reductase [Clostridia bacterium]